MSGYLDITQETLEHLVELLEKKDFKKNLIKEINDDVNIPLINEKTEAKVMEAIYKQIIKALKNVDLTEK